MRVYYPVNAQSKAAGPMLFRTRQCVSRERGPLDGFSASDSQQGKLSAGITLSPDNSLKAIPQFIQK